MVPRTRLEGVKSSSRQAESVQAVEAMEAVEAVVSAEACGSYGISRTRREEAALARRRPGGRRTNTQIILDARSISES